MVFGPLTGDPELDKDLAEDHQRKILEEKEAEDIAEGDPEVHEGSYKPITESEDDFLETPDSNRFIKKK
jgi:hypothetical protein